jgi:peptide/nickel transport system permease protein
VLKFILHRALATVPVLFLLSVIVFSLIHLIPGDPVQIMLGEENDPQALEALRRELGLDRPLVEQFLRWLWRLLQGDFGRSLRSHQPVLEAVGERLPVTLELTLLAMLISLSIALPTGVIAALRRNSTLDVLCTMTALSGVSIPNFFLGILLIVTFAQELQWLPSSGYVSPLQSLQLNLATMLLPAVTLGTGLAAIVMRMTRSSLLEVLRHDYVLTARAKGVADAAVIMRHALKNALLPVTTILGLQMGTLLGGAVLTETIFALPGLGRLVVDSIFARDFPIVQGVILFLALTRIACNFVVDITYALLDPRIRYE